MASTVFTIGYERRSPDGLVRDLAGAGVTLLADVRELPLSRRRGFSRTALAAALGQAGLAYVHERALGNPKPYRDPADCHRTLLAAALAERLGDLRVENL
jgi:uncharacterized protein (DUF488 family)